MGLYSQKNLQNLFYSKKKFATDMFLFHLSLILRYQPQLGVAFSINYPENEVVGCFNSPHQLTRTIFSKKKNRTMKSAL